MWVNGETHHVTPLYDCISLRLGGVPFLEQGLSTSSLPTSDSAGSSISSPTTTDSGLDTCSKATSREDLSDLDQFSPPATTPSTATTLPGTEPGSPDAQVWLFIMSTTISYLPMISSCEIVFIVGGSLCVLK